MKRIKVFQTTTNGCIVCTSHKHNRDGYLRTYNVNKNVLHHRFVWELRVGPIPEGHEINHLCGNRACQNVEHLECISGLEHTIKTNVERYSTRTKVVYDLLMQSKSVKEIVGVTGLSQSAVYKKRKGMVMA
jgi:hypothetical protein